MDHRKKAKKPSTKPPSRPTKRTTTRKNAVPDAAEIDPTFAPLVEAFAKDRQVVRAKGWGAGNTVLKVKGKIFAMTVGGNLVAKLPNQRVAELVKIGKGDYFDPRRDGRLMKEWVVVGVGRENWLLLAKEAHQFVKGK